MGGGTGDHAGAADGIDPVDAAIEVLNRIHAADPSVLQSLFDYRVPCNEVVADDPTVQVGLRDRGANPGYEVGLLGIINGLYGSRADGKGGFIAGVYTDDGVLESITRLEDGS